MRMSKFVWGANILVVVIVGFLFAPTANAENLVPIKAPINCSELRSCCTSDDGKYLVIGRKNGNAALVRLSDFQEQEFESTGEVTAVAISPDNSKVGLACGNVVQIWDTASGQCLHSMSGHTDRIDCLGFSSDSSLLVSAGLDKSLRVWRVDKGSLCSAWIGDKAWLRSARFLPGRPIVMSVGWDKILKLWNVSNGNLVRKIPSSAVTSCDFEVSPDCKLIACCTYNYNADSCVLNLLDFETGSILDTIYSGKLVYRPRFSSDGKSLAFSGEGDLYLYDLSTKTLAAKVVHPGAIWLPTADGPISMSTQSAKRWVPASQAAVLIAAKTAKKDLQQDRVEDRKPTETVAAVPAKKQNPDRPITDKWALVVGISKFKNSNYDLRYAAKDAKDFYTYLVNDAGFKKDHVLLLLDGAATRENIITAFGDKFLPAVAQPDDMIVVFVSTHGTPKHKDQGGRNYIVAHDTDINKLYATGVDMDELYRRVKEAVPSDRALIVMDTCYSGGGVPGAKAMNDGANFSAAELAQGSGHLVITSSSPNERSWESQITPNGVFTKYLLETLRAKKGDVKLSFSEAQEKVSWEVKSAFNTTQTPQLGGEWEGRNLMLGLPVTKPRLLFNAELIELIKRGDPDLKVKPAEGKTVPALKVIKSSK